MRKIDKEYYEGLCCGFDSSIKKPYAWNVKFKIVNSKNVVFLLYEELGFSKIKQLGSFSSTKISKKLSKNINKVDVEEYYKKETIKTIHKIQLRVKFPFLIPLYKWWSRNRDIVKNQLIVYLSIFVVTLFLILLCSYPVDQLFTMNLTIFKIWKFSLILSTFLNLLSFIVINGIGLINYVKYLRPKKRG